MQLIPISTPTKTPAEQIAEAMVDGINAELDRRVSAHRSHYIAFWGSAPTPDDILSALGANAPIVLAAASENVDHIGNLAAIVGKTVTDFLPAEYWQPRRAFIVTNGVVTLASPAEGFDAWGNPIPQP